MLLTAAQCTPPEIHKNRMRVSALDCGSLHTTTAQMRGTADHMCVPLLALQQRPDQLQFISCDGRCISSWEFVHRVAALSYGLRKQLNATAGDRIMIAALNTDYMLEALLAVCDSGCIATPVNHRWSAAELSAAMELTKPLAILADTHCSKLVVDAIQMLQQSKHSQTLTHARNTAAPLYVHLGQELNSSKTTIHAYNCQHIISSACNELAPQQQLLSLQLNAPTSGAAMIVFTSGTTGKPKGVLLSHAAFNTQSLAKLAMVGYCSTDVYMHMAPLFHIGGLSSAMACIMAGAAHVLLPRFTAPLALQAMMQNKVTTFIAVPAIMQDLIVHAKAGSPSHTYMDNFPVVRCILMGGGVTNQQLKDGMSKVFPNAKVMSAYGMTEACSSMTFMTVHGQQSQSSRLQSDHLSQQTFDIQSQAAVSMNSNSSQLSVAATRAGLLAGASCAGWPAPGIAIKIDPLDSRDATATDGSSTSRTSSLCQRDLKMNCTSSVQPYQDGQVWTKGPHTMIGYWEDETETNKVTSSDGWLKTGDLGFFDEQGALWLRGRAKDMIKSGGENVYAAEVESALCKHPAVAAAVVVGLPHDRLGETVCALIVLNPGHTWLGVHIPSDAWLQGGHNNDTVTQKGANSHQLHGDRQALESDKSVDALALQAHCRHLVQLSPYKLPRMIAAVVQGHNTVSSQPFNPLNYLPTNSSGKVLKDRVKLALHQALSSAGVQQFESDPTHRSRL